MSSLAGYNEARYIEDPQNWAKPLYQSRFNLTDNVKVEPDLNQFPYFTADTPEDLEDWVDLAARVVSNKKLTVQEFKTLWCHTPMKVSLKGKVMKGYDGGDYEDLVDSIATSIFPMSFYPLDIEDKLINCPTFPSLEEAGNFLIHTYSRLVRVSYRYAVRIGLNDIRMQKILYNCVPGEYRSKVSELLMVCVDASDLMGRLMWPMDSNQLSDTADQQSVECNCCGGNDHYQTQCHARKYKCRRCGAIGHLAKMCTAIAEDTKKRSRAEQNHGTVDVQRSLAKSSKVDPSIAERMVSVENAVAQLLIAKFLNGGEQAKKRNRKRVKPKEADRASRLCECCGKSHLRNNCPSKNFKCRTCGIIGHIARMCPAEA